MDKFYAIGVAPLAAEDGGGFLGIAPDLKGCISHGDTPEEAFANARDAVLEWIDEAQSAGRRIPEPGECAAKMRSDRDSLVMKIKQQSVAIEAMDSNIQNLEANIATLKRVLRTLTARLSEAENPQLTWAGLVAVRIPHSGPRVVSDNEYH